MSKKKIIALVLMGLQVFAYSGIFLESGVSLLTATAYSFAYCIPLIISGVLLILDKTNLTPKGKKYSVQKIVALALFGVQYIIIAGVYGTTQNAFNALFYALGSCIFIDVAFILLMLDKSKVQTQQNNEAVVIAAKPELTEEQKEKRKWVIIACAVWGVIICAVLSVIFFSI